MIQQWIGFSITFPYDKYVLLVLGTIIYIYGGMPFFKGMVSELRVKAMGMMTLVAIAITVAYLYSVAVVFCGNGFLLGTCNINRYYAIRTLVGNEITNKPASKALRSLVELLPLDVNILQNGIKRKIKLQQLKNGDTVIIKPGEKIPADGLVLEGRSYT